MEERGQFIWHIPLRKIFPWRFALAERSGRVNTAEDVDKGPGNANA